MVSRSSLILVLSMGATLCLYGLALVALLHGVIFLTMIFAAVGGGCCSVGFSFQHKGKRNDEHLSAHSAYVNPSYTGES